MSKNRFWKARKNLDKTYLFFILVFFGFFMFKLYQSHYYHLTIWDESVYIGIGKYLYSGGEVGLLEDIRPIGLPLILGLFWRLGFNILKTGEIISILFGTGSIIMTYLLGKKLYNKNTGMISAVLLAFSPVFFYFSSFALTSIPSLFFSLAAIYLFKEKKYFFSGLFCGITFLIRYPQGLLFASLVLLSIKNFKDVKKIVLGFLCIVIPLLLYNLFMYGNFLQPFISASTHQSNEVNSVLDSSILSKVHNFLYYFIELLKQNILSVFFFISILFYIKKKEKFIIIPFLYLIYFTLINNKQTRFSIVFIPLIYIFSINYLLIKLKRFKTKDIIIILVLSSLIYPTILIYQDTKLRGEYVPQINDYYQFIINQQFETKILTTDPTPIAYSDIKLIPAYSSVEDFDIDFGKYTGSNVIIYTSEYYPCFNELCYKKKLTQIKKISTNRSLIFNESYFGQDYLIYS